MSRFIVTELEGINGMRYRIAGLSCHVIDTLWNHRLIATYRIEDYHGGTRASHWRQVRERAEAHRAELEARYG